MEKRNLDDSKGGVERGKDYNHSSFCNLIISGLMGVRPQEDGSIIINLLFLMDVGTIFVWIMYIAKAKPLPLFLIRKGKNMVGEKVL